MRSAIGGRGRDSRAARGQVEEQLLEAGRLGRAEVDERDAARQRGAADLGGLGVDDVAAVRQRAGASGRRPPARRASAPRPSRGRACPAPASSSSRLPWATIRPLPMITSWSATASTSRSRCEDSSTVPPRSAKSRSRPRIQRMPSGSSPLAGSSRISDLGIAEQRVGDAQALAHAQRVLAHALAGGRAVEADELEQLVDARARRRP